MFKLYTYESHLFVPVGSHDYDWHDDGLQHQIEGQSKPISCNEIKNNMEKYHTGTNLKI